MKSRKNNEEQRSDLEDRKIEIRTADRKPNEKKKNNVRDLWDNIKCQSMHNRDSKRRRERGTRKGIKSVFEEIMEPP